MTYTQAENFNSFLQAFEYLSQENQMVADYYISYYWNEDFDEWEYDMIDEKVVREIQQDVQYNTYS
jgi:hypothetical protein